MFVAHKRFWLQVLRLTWNLPFGDRRDSTMGHMVFSKLLKVVSLFFTGTGPHFSARTNAHISSHEDNVRNRRLDLQGELCRARVISIEY